MRFDRTFTGISGFTQSSKKHNGTIQTVLDVLDSKQSIYCSYYPWDVEPEEIAWALHRMMPGSKHYLLGYSYGGMTATRTANHLTKLGEHVERLILVDPVWRPWAWPSLTSLLPFWKIRVTGLVNDVQVYHQEVDMPKGHQVYHGQLKVKMMKLELPHNEIDDAEEPRKFLMDLLLD